MGGVISPGVTISAEALFQRAAKLPRIDVRDPGQVHLPEYRILYAGGYVLWLCRSSGRTCITYES